VVDARLDDDPSGPCPRDGQCLQDRWRVQGDRGRTDEVTSPVPGVSPGERAIATASAPAAGSEPESSFTTTRSTVSRAVIVTMAWTLSSSCATSSATSSRATTSPRVRPRYRLGATTKGAASTASWAWCKLTPSVIAKTASTQQRMNVAVGTRATRTASAPEGRVGEAVTATPVCRLAVRDRRSATVQR
jgi:hypothetical protein